MINKHFLDTRLHILLWYSRVNHESPSIISAQVDRFDEESVCYKLENLQGF